MTAWAAASILDGVKRPQMRHWYRPIATVVGEGDGMRLGVNTGHGRERGNEERGKDVQRGHNDEGKSLKWYYEMIKDVSGRLQSLSM